MLSTRRLAPTAGSEDEPQSLRRNVESSLSVASIECERKDLSGHTHENISQQEATFHSVDVNLFSDLPRAGRHRQSEKLLLFGQYFHRCGQDLSSRILLRPQKVTTRYSFADFAALLLNRLSGPTHQHKRYPHSNNIVRFQSQSQWH